MSATERSTDADRGTVYPGHTALLAPRSVAIIGASADPTRIGGRPIAYMRRSGFAGAILPVNPNRNEVQGLRCYPSVADLPQVPEAAVIAVPVEAAIQAVESLGARGTKAAIVFTSGFAEVGAEGALAQERLIRAAARHGIRILGPNCLGLFNVHSGYYPIFSASFESGFPLPGRVGIASQSGAYGTHLFATARKAGIGTAMLVTTGNEADVTLADAITAMVADQGIDVILAYAEGVRDGEAFVSALEEARRARKPIVMMKVGRSEVGSAAAQSHTASIAGNDAIFDAVLSEHGVVRARSTEELLDIGRLATRRIYPERNTLGVMTISGGAGVLISDAAEVAGLLMPEMPAEAQAVLKSAIPFSSVRNPVDCTAQVFNDMSAIGLFTETMVRDGRYASMLAFFTAVGGAASMVSAIRSQLNHVKQSYPDRLYVLSVVASPEQEAEYQADGYVNFEDPARAVIAIEAMGRFGAAFAAATHGASPEVAPTSLPAQAPNELEAKRLLAACGIQAPPECACPTADEAVAAAEALGFPVVMKILSPDIVHKSEIGGVILGIGDVETVRAAYATLNERAREHAPGARVEGVLVAQQLEGQVECILGIHRDPVFGPVAMFGLGGIFVEVMKDVVFRRCPFGEDVAEQMIRSIKGAPLLLGARGRKPADIPALAQMLSRLSAFAAAAGPRLLAVDLNPVFAMPDGEGAYAADAVIELAAES